MSHIILLTRGVGNDEAVQRPTAQVPSAAIITGGRSPHVSHAAIRRLRGSGMDPHSGVRIDIENVASGKAAIQILDSKYGMANVLANNAACFI